MNDEDMFSLFDGIETDPMDAEILVDACVDAFTEMEVSAVEQAIDQALTEISANSDVQSLENEIPDMVNASDNAVANVEHDGMFDPLFRIFDDFWFALNDCPDIVTEHHFTDGGHFDVKNNVIVEGNVANDIRCVDQQTHSSCSLMAQEQFVERYTGQSIPEDYLEWRAKEWDVYDPDLGTSFSGQTKVLEHFNIPFERNYLCDMEDLDEALQSGNDTIIGVDARVFYGNPNIPPGSGHAVAVVGRGIDPETHEVKGYYVTDSNFSDAAHFVDANRLEDSWSGLCDMIVIPEKVIA